MSANVQNESVEFHTKSNGRMYFYSFCYKERLKEWEGGGLHPTLDEFMQATCSSSGKKHLLLTWDAKFDFPSQYHLYKEKKKTYEFSKHITLLFRLVYELGLFCDFDDQAQYIWPIHVGWNFT